MIKYLIIILVFLCPISKVEAKTEQAEIERLSTLMYKYYSSDSIDLFMSVTDSLKQICLKSGDEATFYKAWGNQATYAFSKKSREEGLAIAKAERTYAEEHDSKWGFYTSTNTYATLMSSIGMLDESAKAFQQAIDYQRRFFPKESAAFQYIGLAKIEHNRHHFDKVIEYAEKALAEPGIIPIHKLSAYNYLCAGLGGLLNEKSVDSFLKQKFNKAYALRQQLIEEEKLSDSMGGIVRYYEAKVNGRYNELPELAQKVQGMANRLAFIPVAWESVGDFKKAYYSFKNYKMYTDSVNRAEIGRATSEYGVQLDLARAENEMKDLRIANQEHREHIHHIIMGTVGLIAVIVIASLLFHLHRRNKHNKEIETAYEKLENTYEELEKAYEKLEVTTKAKERMESELRIAREIQMDMVPRIFPAFPERHDIDIYASLNSAKEVGATENRNGMFVTMFIGEINLRTGCFEFCNAGHNPPLIIDRPLDIHQPCRPNFIEVESNVPIGLWPDLEFVGESISNIKDRTLFLYTDGLTEAENYSQEQFGEDRLYHLFQTRPFESARQTVDMANTAVLSYVGGAEQSDDLTMLCIRVK